jgi:hypothetical protein
MGTLLGLIGMALSAYLLLKTVRGFRRAWREAEIVRGAAAPQQTIRFDSAGEISLFLDGPRYRTYTKRLQYEMICEGSGLPVPITPVYAGSGVRSLTRSRVQRGRFTLPAPGSYTLRIGGLSPTDPTEYAIVFMRPFTRELLTFIFTCVLLGMALLGCLMLAIFSAVF